MRSRVKFKIGSLLVAVSLMLTGCGADMWRTSENKGYSDTPPEEFPESIDEALERHGFGDEYYDRIYESHIERFDDEQFDFGEVFDATDEEFIDGVFAALQEDEPFREELLFATTDRYFTMSEGLTENVAAFRDLGGTACRVVPDAERAEFFTKSTAYYKLEEDYQDVEWLVTFSEETGEKFLERATEQHPALAASLRETYDRESRAQEEIVDIGVLFGSATYCPSTESEDFLEYFLHDLY